MQPIFGKLEQFVYKVGLAYFFDHGRPVYFCDIKKDERGFANHFDMGRWIRITLQLVQVFFA